MARSDPQINIRIPAELKDRLDEAASKIGVSLTAEIVRRLESTFPVDLESELREVKERELDILRSHTKRAEDEVKQLRAAIRSSPLSDVLEIRAELKAAEALADDLRFRYKRALDDFSRPNENSTD